MIEIQGLTKYYGAFCAVDNLSLVVPRGELFCFLGPNGAGKTTTIKMMCGLLHPSAGTVKLDGLDVAKNLETIRRRIGYIPDTPFLYERLTPSEFFEFIGDLYGINREEMGVQRARFFKMFGMEEHAQTLIKDLSHGFRQRLIYAATFLHKPAVLFVDEPFVGLDPLTIRLIRDLLKEKTRAGMTIFLTTHILAFAENLADRIGIITGGRLVATGTFEELKTKSAVQGTLEDVFLSLTTSGNHA